MGCYKHRAMHCLSPGRARDHPVMEIVPNKSCVRMKTNKTSPPPPPPSSSSSFSSSFTAYYQTQVSLQGTGSEPLGLGPSSSVENRTSLACLPGYQREK